MAGCFPATAKVFTFRGLVPMEELRRGDKILAHVNGEEQFTTVTGWLHHEEQESDYLKLKFEEGSVMVSAKHNIATAKNTYSFADEASHVFGQGEIISVEKIKAKGLYAPKTESNNYYVFIDGTDADMMLAHCFAHIRNPTFYEGMFSLVESTWNLFDPSAVSHDVHPSYTWMQEKLTLCRSDPDPETYNYHT